MMNRYLLTFFIKIAFLKLYLISLTPQFSGVKLTNLLCQKYNYKANIKKKNNLIFLKKLDLC